MRSAFRAHSDKTSSFADLLLNNRFIWAILGDQNGRLHKMAALNACFACLDDLAIQRALSFCTVGDLLRAALISAGTLTVARSDELWYAHYLRLRDRFPLGFPPWDALHPAARMTLASLGHLPVKSLKILAEILAIPAREVTACSEKSEICRLVFERQSRIADEVLSSPHTPQGGRGVAMERTWDNAYFASFWYSEITESPMLCLLLNTMG